MQVKILRRAEAQKQGTPGLQAAEPQLSPQPELHRVYAEAQRKRWLAAACINVGSRAVAHGLLKVYMARRAINGLQEPSYSNMQVSSKSMLLSGLITRLRSATASVAP
ncbi:hypothetical protein MMC34_008210 [Xylographa carneopallida]|nr:hypothetical protein [Xylographa carneopallida]